MGLGQLWIPKQGEFDDLDCVPTWSEQEVALAEASDEWTLRVLCPKDNLGALSLAALLRSSFSAAPSTPEEQAELPFDRVAPNLLNLGLCRDVVKADTGDLDVMWRRVGSDHDGMARLTLWTGESRLALVRRKIHAIGNSICTDKARLPVALTIGEANTVAAWAGLTHYNLGRCGGPRLSDPSETIDGIRDIREAKWEYAFDPHAIADGYDGVTAGLDRYIEAVNDDIPNPLDWPMDLSPERAEALSDALWWMDAKETSWHVLIEGGSWIGIAVCFAVAGIFVPRLFKGSVPGLALLVAGSSILSKFQRFSQSEASDF